MSEEDIRRYGDEQGAIGERFLSRGMRLIYSREPIIEAEIGSK